MLKYCFSVLQSSSCGTNQTRTEHSDTLARCKTAVQAVCSDCLQCIGHSATCHHSEGRLLEDHTHVEGDCGKGELGAVWRSNPNTRNSDMIAFYSGSKSFDVFFSHNLNTQALNHPLLVALPWDEGVSDVSLQQNRFHTGQNCTSRNEKP